MGNSESKNTESRVVGGAIGGSASAAGIGGGIPLMVLGGPVGLVAGGILLETGISTATSTVQQCATDKALFDLVGCCILCDAMALHVLSTTVCRTILKCANL